MKTLKKLAQFVVITLTSAVTVLFFVVLLFRTELIIDLISSKPILFMIGLIAGLTTGFLVGVLATYQKLNDELLTKKQENQKLKKDLAKSEKLLEKMLPDIMDAQELRATRSTQEARVRAQQVLREIADLSDAEEDEDNLSSDET